METEIVIAIITGVVAILLSLIAITERRMDKITEKKKAAKIAELEIIKEHTVLSIKELADEIALHWQKRVTDLETLVTDLKKRVEDLEKELCEAYAEIKRLKAIRGSRKKTTT